MPYSVAPGWDNAAGLTALSVQPKTEGIEEPEVIIAGDAHGYDKGASRLELIYTALSPTQYNALLSETGLDDARSVRITLQARNNDDRTFANYNAVIYRPRAPKYRNPAYRDIVFSVLIVEAL